MARNSKTITFAKTEIEMEKITSLIRELCECMEITDKEDGFFIRYGISNGVFVELNTLAEFKLLPNILFETKIYNNIGDSWANITIAEKINNLVPKLGELKLLNDPDINFDSITKDYILDFSTNLPEIECFIPILGLTVDTELDI